MAISHCARIEFCAIAKLSSAVTFTASIFSASAFVSRGRVVADFDYLGFHRAAFTLPVTPLAVSVIGVVDDGLEIIIRLRLQVFDDL